MSWLYVPGSEVSASVSSSQIEATARCATWRGKHSASTTWSIRCRRVPWIKALCGRISPPSTAASGVESWTSSLRASLASRGPQRATGSARRTSAGCGPTSPGSSARSSQAWSSWRTSHSMLFDDPDLTWKEWATESRRRSASLRRTWARLTSESGGSFWPTVIASDARRGPVNYPRGNPGLAAVAANWATVCARDAKGPFKKHRNGGDDLSRQAAKLVFGMECHVLLNPAFTDWLQGFPTEWTGSGPSATQLSHWWSLMRGELSRLG